MINKYKIIAIGNGGVELDTTDVDISLNYQIDDILDITKRATSFSKTIKLPGTPTNNKFFKQIFDVNIDAIYFNPVKRIPIVIRVGTNDVMNGFMQLISIDNLNGFIEYQVTIAGSLKNILSSIADFNLSELDLSEYNHIRSQENIVASWDYNIYKWGSLTQVGKSGEGYVYPYIINGNSTGIWSNMYIYDMYPAVFLKTIIDKIFQFTNFTYSSKFFESEYFKSLIIPFNQDKLQLSDEQVEERSVRAGVNASFIQLTPYRQNNTDWYYSSLNNYALGLDRESGTVNDSGGELTFTDELGQWNGSIFTCAINGYYDIDFVGKLFARYKHQTGGDIKWDANSLEYNYRMELVRNNGSVIVLASSNGTQLITPSDGIDHPSPWLDIANPLEMSMNASNVAMDAGDRIRISVGHRHPGYVNWAGTDSNISSQLVFEPVYDGEFTKFTVEPSSNILMGNEMIDMNQILDRKLKMKSFFLDILKMFNLVLQDDPNNVGNVIIEPRDDFFTSRQRVLNWDEQKKLDNDSLVKITPMSELDFKTYTYKYADDSDFYNTEYKEETGRIYGDYEIVVDNDFSDKQSKLEVGFAATPVAQQFIDSRIAPFFVDFDGEEMKPKKVKPRILFYSGTKNLYSGSTLYLRDYEEQSNADSTACIVYPYCGMWDDPTSPKWSLEFGRTEKIYYSSNNTFPNRNLFEEFHKQTMMNIIDINSKMLECTVYLTPKDIAEFDFRDIVFLLGSYWRVNKIEDYNPVQTDRLTKVVLYKIIDIDVIDRYTVEVPTSNKTCPVDMVSKRTKQGIIIVSQSGLEVTADCCKSLGGTMINGVCRVRPFKPEPIGVELISRNKRPYLSSGIDVVPISDKDGPIILSKFKTSRNSLGVTTLGSGNYVAPGSNTGVIIGSNSTISPNVEGAVVIGDGISATEDGAVYVGDIIIMQDGMIRRVGINILDGGEDEVMEPSKTNPVDIVDGTIDAVRNIGGYSNQDVYVDGNPDSGF